MFWTKKSRLAAFIDYENIVLGPDFKNIDFRKLQEKLLEIGNIDFSFVFIPSHCADSLLRKRINDVGFDIVLCQKQSKENSDIMEDTVDIEMIRFIFKFSRYYDEVTDIVIISDDRHLIEGEREVRNNKKEVHRWGKREISDCLVDIRI